MCPFFDHYLFNWIPDKVRYVLRCCVPSKDEEYNLNAEKAHSMSTFGEVSSLQKRSIVNVVATDETPAEKKRLPQ